MLTTLRLFVRPSYGIRSSLSQGHLLAFHFSVKMFHNDNFGIKYSTFPLLRIGREIFNFSHLADLNHARELLAKASDNGHIPGLEVLTIAADEVLRETKKRLTPSARSGAFILRQGRGVARHARRNGWIHVALEGWNASGQARIKKLIIKRIGLT